MEPRILQRVEKIEDDLENAVLRIVNRLLSASAISAGGVLVGTVLAFAGDMDGAHPINPVTRTADTSYALCNGESYFSESVGGMITTPDLRDRFIIGSGNSLLYGQTGGSLACLNDSAYTVTVSPTTLTAEQVPVHSHGTVLGSASSNGKIYTPVNALVLTSTFTAATTTAGGGASHSHTAQFVFPAAEKTPPYFAMCYIMKI